METSIELIFVVVSILLVLSVVAGKISARFGIPSLLLFLIIGMLAGSEGIGGIYFDNAAVAQAIGIFSLVIILFSGGIEAEWREIRPVVGPGLVLATLGVLVTAGVVGVAASWLLGLTLAEGLLLGAIVSPTDAAAVFSLLPALGIRLKRRITPLLEFESGSNDPMAVFLTIGLIELIQHPGLPFTRLLLMFAQEMVIGAVFGWAAGGLLVVMINRLKLGYNGLYPVLVLGMLLLTFGAAGLAEGSGFLAVYLVGLQLARADFLHKASLKRFYGALAGLAEIVMLLTLGLLVFPSQLAPVIVPGLILAAVLILVARPLAVFLSLLPFRFPWRETAFLSWVGLRGAVPIILATFPMLAGLVHSGLIFNMVFFIVLTSILIQGRTTRLVARLLQVEDTGRGRPAFPVEITGEESLPARLSEVTVPEDSWAVGRAIYQLRLPAEFLVVLVARGDEFVIPNGSTVLRSNDRLLGLADPGTHGLVKTLLEKTEKIPNPPAA